VLQSATMKAAVGFRLHSGWTALSILAAPLNFPVVVDRWRVDLADPAIDSSKQPYHAAERLRPEEAQEMIARCAASTTLLANEGVKRAIEESRRRGYTVVGCGVLLASGKPLPALPLILASHALIHAAEGEFFRSAVLQACSDNRLPVAGVKEKELLIRCWDELDIPRKDLEDHLAHMGRSIGSPWRQDEKFATLAAWLALAAALRPDVQRAAPKTTRLPLR